MNTVKPVYKKVQRIITVLHYIQFLLFFIAAWGAEIIFLLKIVFFIQGWLYRDVEGMFTFSCLIKTINISWKYFISLDRDGWKNALQYCIYAKIWSVHWCNCQFAVLGWLAMKFCFYEVKGDLQIHKKVGKLRSSLRIKNYKRPWNKMNIKIPNLSILFLGLFVFKPQFNFPIANQIPGNHRYSITFL